MFLLGSYGFLFFACLGAICKAIVGVAGAATRVCMTQHQAKANNLSGKFLFQVLLAIFKNNISLDVSAKDGSQETAVNLIGLGIGFIITPLLQTQRQIWTLFFVFSTFHIFFNYCAVRSIVMESLNQTRASILIRNFLSNNSKIFSLLECNRKESILQ